MKKIIPLLIALVLWSCGTNNQIDIFGSATYTLADNEKIVKNIPENEVLRQVVDTYFKEQQLPLFRTIQSGITLTYVTIPVGLDFDSQSLTNVPANCNLLDKSENADTKYIAYACEKSYVAVYLRKIQHNTICLVVSGKEQTSFEKVAKKEIIDKKIVLKNE